MGTTAHQFKYPSIQNHSPPIDEYELLGTNPNFSIWYNPLLTNSLIEISFIKNNNSNIQQEQIQSYLWRHRHYLFVSTLYYKENNENFFSIYYERIITNLSRIKDLTFQDSLMFYYIGLRAFQLLFQKFGFFDVQEQMFHITENNKVKIWCDKNISRIYPPAKAYGSQQAMVRKIIHIISSNTDPSQLKVPIGAFLNQEVPCTFHNTINKFRTISKQFNLVIPNQLTCLQTLRNGGILKMVDQFAIQQQKPVVQPEKQIMKKSSKAQSVHKSQTKIKTYQNLTKSNKVIQIQQKQIKNKFQQNPKVNNRAHSLPSVFPARTIMSNSFKPIIRQIKVQPINPQKFQIIQSQVIRPQSLDHKKSHFQTPERNPRAIINTSHSQKIIQIPTNNTIITFNRNKSFEKLIPQPSSSINLAKPPIPPNRFIPRLQSPLHNPQKLIFKSADVVKQNMLISKKPQPQIVKIKEQPNSIQSVEKEIKQQIHDVSIDRALEQLEKIEKMNGMGMPSRENLFSARGLSQIDDKLTSFDILEPTTEINMNFKQVKSETFLFDKNTHTNLSSVKLLQSKIQQKIKFFQQKAAQMKQSFKTQKTLKFQTKKYIPHIDDDIWKDLQLMKTKKNIKN